MGSTIGSGVCGRTPGCTLPPHLERDPCRLSEPRDARGRRPRLDSPRTRDHDVFVRCNGCGAAATLHPDGTVTNGDREIPSLCLSNLYPPRPHGPWVYADTWTRP